MTMLFYDKIVPLNRERHSKLKLRTDLGKADFAGAAHYVPVAANELYQAARDFPVVFAGNEQNLGLVALLGLREGENLFVGAEGAWANGSYVPAFVRRYPFILAKGDEDNYTVCFDETYAGFSEEEGRELFTENGEDSEYLKGVVTFLDNFRAEMERTKLFVERLRGLDLLVKRELRVTDGKGRNFFLRDLYLVDEEKLNQLKDAALGELQRDGFLGWIYAHLISVGNASRLPVRVTGGEQSQPADAVAH